MTHDSRGKFSRWWLKKQVKFPECDTGLDQGCMMKYLLTQQGQAVILGRESYATSSGRFMEEEVDDKEIKYYPWDYRLSLPQGVSWVQLPVEGCTGKEIYHMNLVVQFALIRPIPTTTILEEGYQPHPL